MRPGSSSERSFFGRRCRDQRRGDHKERRRERLDRVPDQATLRGRQSGEGAERRAASRGRNTNSRARKKPYWWRPPAPVRQRAVPAGPQAAGGCDGQAHPNTRACRTRRFGGAWPKMASSPGERHVCIPQVDGEYVAHMEDVLDLYAEASDSRRKVVCFRKPGATHRRGASVVRLLRFLASESAVLNKFAAERLTTSVVVTVFTCTCCHRAGNPTNDGDWDLAARGRTIYRFDK
jgi:hypothetical protein